VIAMRMKWRLGAHGLRRLPSVASMHVMPFVRLTRRTVIVCGAIAGGAIAVGAASAPIALAPWSSGTPGNACVPQDRMPIAGCLPGAAARQRAEGGWRLDPGILAWADHQSDTTVTMTAPQR
jgi:hypothetical protein